MPDEIVPPQDLPQRTRQVYSSGSPTGGFNSSLSDQLGLTIVDPRLLDQLATNARIREQREFQVGERRNHEDFLREQAAEAEAKAGRVRERKRAGLEEFLTSQQPALSNVFPSLYQNQPREGAMAEPEAAGIAPEQRAVVPEGSEDLLSHIVSGAYGNMAAMAVKGDEYTRALKTSGFKSPEEFQKRRSEMADTFRQYGMDDMADVMDHLDDPKQFQRLAQRAIENKQRHEQRLTQTEDRLNQQQKNAMDRINVIFGMKEKMARLQADLKEKGIVNHDSLRALQAQVGSVGQQLRAEQSELTRQQDALITAFGPNKQRVLDRIGKLNEQITTHTTELDRLQGALDKIAGTKPPEAPPIPNPSGQPKVKISKQQYETMKANGWSDDYIDKKYEREK